MVESIHRYLDEATDKAAASQERFWDRAYSSYSAYDRSVAPNRERLRVVLGLVDDRLPIEALEFVATTDKPSRVASGSGYSVEEVRWESLPGVYGVGLLLEPDSAPIARIVAVPDASWSSEMLAGLANGLPPEAQFARRLAENGCQVVIPTLIDRTARWTGLEGFRRSNLPHREFLFRMSYELGRHLIGYEIQKILSVVDFFAARNSERQSPVGIIGYGEGGLLALYTGAGDQRIEVTAVSGYFQQREDLWRETIDRNVWGLFGGVR